MMWLWFIARPHLTTTGAKHHPTITWTHGDALLQGIINRLHYTKDIEPMSEKWLRESNRKNDGN